GNIFDIKKIKPAVAVLIGPEGGFSEKETNLVKSYDHVCSISLGNTVLRTETAVSAVLACVQMKRSNC
ncbi:MAG: RsmE family RNA methyltransferase, partial [Rickettsiaceae bacterium]|nr:RsmE family RNA methyltransferase [Rickettsiaceae bacterium]